MQIGFVGLGKMGGNMVERLARDGHQVVVFDTARERVLDSVGKGATGSDSYPDLVKKLPVPRVVWLMVPSGEIVDKIIADIAPLLTAGDIVVDGGNSYYKDSVRRHDALKARGIFFIDCGTSGGVWGLQQGYCLMYGGEQEAAAIMEPVFKSLAPPEGYLYCGPSGSGHLVKMIHNGIEYGMMEAYAEGFDILRASPYGFDLAKIASVWTHGSVVRSWLLDLAVLALTTDPRLDGLEPWVADSGEGRWTVVESIERAVPAPVLSLALQMRFASRDKNSFAQRLLAALRNEFGGHPVRSREEA